MNAQQKVDWIYGRSRKQFCGKAAPDGSECTLAHDHLGWHECWSGNWLVRAWAPPVKADESEGAA